MSKETKALLIKYGVCFGAASLITVVVFWIKGFFTHNVAVNVQILSDGFFVSGALLTMLAGLLYISGEGALIGLGFILRNVVLAFIPMGRTKHELYADYRERKMSQIKKSGDHALLFTGLFFLLIGVVFTVLWYVKFYNMNG